jgi:L-asparaginase II
VAAVRAGVPERLGLGADHLAIACASHGGGDPHVLRVRELLRAAGCAEADLGCGPAEPRDPAAAAAHRDAGGRPEPVRHNCSGKHAFGVAFAVAEGWPVEGYLDAGHPLQEAMERGMAEATRVEPGELARAVDGCGMQTFSVPIARLAAAFGRLASGGLGAAGEQLATAMTDHPELVAYDGALDTEMMRAHPRLVSKIGAEGVMGLGLPDGRGAALKVLDGAPRALDLVAPLLVEEHWGIELAGPGVARLRKAPVVNSRGEQVGRAEARLAA